MSSVISDWVEINEASYALNEATRTVYISMDGKLSELSYDDIDEGVIDCIRDELSAAA